MATPMSPSMSTQVVPPSAPSISRQGTDATLAVPMIASANNNARLAPHHNEKAASSRQGSSTTHSRSHSPAPTMLQSRVASEIEHFMGPRDLEKHSRLPYFLRFSGSVTPRLLVPMIFVGAWSTLITVLSTYVYPLTVNTVMLTVLGFVIGLAVSFRTSSAYERYSDGRRYWTDILQSSRDLCRLIWIHVDERHAPDAAVGKADLLGKVTAMNLILTFAVALKHKLRFEPYVNHDDLEHLVTHLQTYAGEAVDPKMENPANESSMWQDAGEFLDICFAKPNPRHAIKHSKHNLGNLPMEVLMHMSAYLADTQKQGIIEGTAYAGCMAAVTNLNAAMAGTERVLNTPLPVAYSIAISQITWVYVLALPFQLFATLKWVTIPGCIISAYVILGLSSIGAEIENPFGNDTNDLPLDSFCKELAQEIDVVCSRPQFKAPHFVPHEKNNVMFNRPYGLWDQKDTEEIRGSLKLKATSARVANNPIEAHKDSVKAHSV